MSDLKMFETCVNLMRRIVEKYDGNGEVEKSDLDELEFQLIVMRTDDDIVSYYRERGML